MSDYRILTINPGSTSTKVAVFQGTEKIFSENISHRASELSKYPEIIDQLPYRKKMIADALQDHDIKTNDFSAVVGRGGGLLAVEGGTYKVNDTLLDHARRGANGVRHPAQLGSLLANEFAKESGCPAYVVNPPDTDELQPIARMTGIKGVYRNVHLHALNLKETAIRHAKKTGVRYEDVNYIVCHIGGGISISAHRKGRMIDGNDIVGGEGPMAPTRCGAVPAEAMIRYCYSGVKESEALELCTKKGGFVSYFGTSDALEIYTLASQGNREAVLVWDAMIYQICKQIGAMASVLEGKVDAILLGGGMVYNEELVMKIREACEYIAPVFAYPGEFEMEAMAAGAVRVLNKEEQPKTYTGKRCWDRKDFE